jgi:hypothetical protein
MPIFPISYSPPRPIHPHRSCDNGAIPTAHLYRQMCEHLNKCARHHPKWFFHSSGIISIPAGGGAGERPRFRFAGHTGLFCRRLRVSAEIALYGSGNPYVQFKVTGGNSKKFYYGNTASTPDDGFDEWGHFEDVIDIAADTDFTMTISDFDNARLVSASVWEETKVADTANGYIWPIFGVHQPIYDAERQSIAQLADNMWKRNGSQVVNWTSETDATSFTRTSTTDINLVDNSSTAISANTPGFYLDDRYKNTLMLATVPCKVFVYGKCAGGGTGHVYIKDSAGTVLCTVNINSTTDAWYSATWNAPATDEKFDIHADSDGVNLTTIRAVSIYEYS